MTITPAALGIGIPIKSAFVSLASVIILNFTSLRTPQSTNKKEKLQKVENVTF